MVRYATKVVKWKFNDFIKMIVATLLNRYDFFLVTEGGTGLGKSTLNLETAIAVSREFKRLYKLDEELINYYWNRIGIKTYRTPEDFMDKIMALKNDNAYILKMDRDLIYSQKEMQTFLSDWNRIGLADEMINVAFNRDFFSDMQKDIVKMVNMFRDHENLILASVPSFEVLDKQIKNLVKMRITIKKRGVGVIQMPNKIIYSSDKWDATTNQKIEREWIIKKTKNPNYAKLTTFRGVIHFPPLSKQLEKRYQEIKNLRRTIILKDEMNINVEDKKDLVDIAIEKLLKGTVKNSSVIEGMAMADGTVTHDQLRERIRKRLLKMEKPASLSYYYWDKKAKSKDEDEGDKLMRIAQKL